MKKSANPFKNNVGVKTALTKMFNDDIAEQLTTKDVYKYKATEQEQLTHMKSLGVKEYETRQRNSDGTITKTNHKIL